MPDEKLGLLEFLDHEARSRGLHFVVIGGWALEAHGYARQTADVDCLIAESALSEFDDLLLHSGFSALARTENFRRYRHAELGYLDLLIVDLATFEKLCSDAQPFEIGNAALRAPSLRNLIALKLHAAKNDAAREWRELADIEQLARRCRVPAEEMKNLCQQFGGPEFWNKLRTRLYGTN